MKNFIKSTTSAGYLAKTYIFTVPDKKSVGILCLQLVSGDIVPYIRQGFKVVRKFKDKYLVAKHIAFQGVTFAKIVNAFINLGVFRLGDKIEIK